MIVGEASINRCPECNTTEAAEIPPPGFRWQVIHDVPWHHSVLVREEP